MSLVEIRLEFRPVERNIIQGLNISLIMEPYGEYNVIFHDVIIMFARDFIPSTDRVCQGLPTKKI